MKSGVLMLKNKIEQKDLLSLENKEFLEKWNVITENPLTYFDPNDPTPMKEYQKRRADSYKYLEQFSLDEIMAYLHGKNVVGALYDNEGNLYLNPSKTITIAGNVIEVLEQSKKSEGPGVIKLDKDHYINLHRPIQGNLLGADDDNADQTIEGYICRNGQYYKIEEYNVSSMKSANELRKTFRRLTNIINANTTDPSRCLWVTLTYADNIKGKEGNEQLYADFKRGIQRLRRKYGKFEYITVVEPQGRGAWHCHCIFIFNKKAPFIPNKEIETAWGQGFTKTKKMNANADNLGSYLTAYLTDIPLDQLSAFDFSTATEMLETCPVVEKEGKQIIKGGRLYLYPPYMKLYRTSRGIQQPTVIKNATDEDVSAAVEDLPALYETMYELTLEEDSAYKNIIRYTQYNKTVTTEDAVEQRRKTLKKSK